MKQIIYCNKSKIIDWIQNISTLLDRTDYFNLLRKGGILWHEISCQCINLNTYGQFSKVWILIFQKYGDVWCWCWCFKKNPCVGTEDLRAFFRSSPLLLFSSRLLSTASFPHSCNQHALCTKRILLLPFSYHCTIFAVFLGLLYTTFPDENDAYNDAVVLELFPSNYLCRFMLLKSSLLCVTGWSEKLSKLSKEHFIWVGLPETLVFVTCRVCII